MHRETDVMAEQGYRSLKACLFFLTLLLLCPFTMGTPASGVVVDTTCNLEDDALTDLKVSVNPLLGQDFSCLISHPEIPSILSTHQIINLYDSENSPLHDVWNLSLHDLKTKKFLSDRNILLTGYYFSRVQAAEDCYILKAAGFKRIKQIVGHPEIFKKEKYRYQKNISDSKNEISGEDFLREYFNGRVLAITASNEVSHFLSSIGIRDFYNTNDYNTLIQIITDKNPSGLYPIVILSDSSGKALDEINHINMKSIFHLENAIDQLQKSINSKTIVNEFKSITPRRQSCGA